METLEKRLIDAIQTYKSRLDFDNRSYSEKRTKFKIYVDLIREMRIAYEKKDIIALEEIPDFGGDKGENAVTFYFSCCN